MQSPTLIPLRIPEPSGRRARLIIAPLGEAIPQGLSEELLDRLDLESMIAAFFDILEVSSKY